MIIHSVYCILFQETTVHALFPFVAMISHGHAIQLVLIQLSCLMNQKSISIASHMHLLKLAITNTWFNMPTHKTSSKNRV